MRSTLSIIIISAIFLIVSIGNVSAADYSPIAWEEVDSQGYYSNPTYAYDNGYNDTSTYALIGGEVNISYGGESITDELRPMWDFIQAGDESIAYIWDTASDGTSDATLYYTWEIPIVDWLNGEVLIKAWNYSSESWGQLRRIFDIEPLATRSLNIGPDYINSTGEIKIEFLAAFSLDWDDEDTITVINLYDVYISKPGVPDTTRPTVTITSPQNKPYNTDFVDLIFYADEPTRWAGYKLDKGSWTTVVGGSTTLMNLSDGQHKVKVSMADLAGNHGYSTVYFTVDTTRPTVTITSPESKKYTTDSVNLIFYADEPTRWAGYKLDKGSWTTVVGGSTTLMNLSDGQHKVKVSMADLAGNHGYSTVYFTVDTTRPTVTITSPESKKYTTDSVNLIFYADEPTRWAGYKLDKGPWVTVIGGSTTLTNLSNGRHKIKVSMADLAGNHGSAWVWFNVRVSGGSSRSRSN